MAFFCKRKISKSKRETIGCKGCKYYEKVFRTAIGSGDVPARTIVDILQMILPLTMKSINK